METRKLGASDHKSEDTPLGQGQGQGTSLLARMVLPRGRTSEEDAAAGNVSDKSSMICQDSILSALIRIPYSREPDISEVIDASS